MNKLYKKAEAAITSIVAAILIVTAGLVVMDSLSQIDIKFESAITGMFVGGNGNSTNPYQINNCSSLQDMENNLSAHYVLVNDIDCSGFDYGDGKGFKPVGTSTTPFTGSLDGQGYTISDLFINRTTTYVGLFGYTGSSISINNITLENVYIRTTQDYSGGFIGRAQNPGSMSNCHVTGYIEGQDYVGGLIGTNYGDPSITIDECSANVNILATGPFGYGGGLIGNNQDGNITNSLK